MKNINKMQVASMICAIMCLLLLITQFLPFWNCSNCKTHKDVDKQVSVAGYVWIPTNHKPITKEMTNVYLEEYGEDFEGEDGKRYKFAVNDIVVPCVIVFMGSLAGLVLNIAFSRRAIVNLIPLVAGSVGAYWYSTCPAMKVGANWQFHMFVAALTAIVALMCLLLNIFWKYGALMRSTIRRLLSRKNKNGSIAA